MSNEIIKKSSTSFPTDSMRIAHPSLRVKSEGVGIESLKRFS
jgi:hypothetical protein